MNICIRQGLERDLPALHGLIKDLASFERAADAVSNTVERMTTEQTYFGFFVAEKGEEIIGAALYFFAYFSWVGKSLYLDDIYVKPDYRGKKVGSQLLHSIFALAAQENCHRLRWQVLDWNTHAIEIYKKLGARISNEWLNCDFNQEEIMSFLKR